MGYVTLRHVIGRCDLFFVSLGNQLEQIDKGHVGGIFIVDVEVEIVSSSIATC